MIQSRNPIYKIKEYDTKAFKQLQNKDLVGIDLQIQNCIIPIRKKQKFIVSHMADLWWVENENFVAPPHIHLYSINEIIVSDGELSIRFCYQNGMILELKEKEIITLVPIRKKAKREDGDIQQTILSMHKA